MRPLTVLVYDNHWDGIHESLFFSDVLLGGLERPVRFHLVPKGQDFPLLHDVLIINLCNGALGQVARLINAGCCNVGVVAWCHTKSEDYSYYRHVDYILRPYFSPAHMDIPPDGRCQDIVWFPNGYKTGIGPRQIQALPDFQHRIHEFFYSGFPGTNAPERVDMLNMLAQSGLPAHIHISNDFSAGLGLNVYRSTMEQTRFALVPGGADDETIRLYEALEMGCIPVSLDHAFLNDDRAMPGAPIVRLTEWSHLPIWYNMVKNRPDYLEFMESYRHGIAVWWDQFKRQQQQKVSATINNSFARFSL